VYGEDGGIFSFIFSKKVLLNKKTKKKVRNNKNKTAFVAASQLLSRSAR